MIIEHNNKLNEISRILVISDVYDQCFDNYVRKEVPPLTSGAINLIHQIETLLRGDFEFLNIHPYFLDQDRSLFPIRHPLPGYPQIE